MDNFFEVLKVHLLKDSSLCVCDLHVRWQMFSVHWYGKATEAKKGGQWRSLSDHKNCADKQRHLPVQQNPRSHSVFEEKTSALTESMNLGVQCEWITRAGLSQFRCVTLLINANHTANNTQALCIHYPKPNSKPKPQGKIYYLDFLITVTTTTQILPNYCESNSSPPQDGDSPSSVSCHTSFFLLRLFILTTVSIPRASFTVYMLSNSKISLSISCLDIFLSRDWEFWISPGAYPQVPHTCMFIKFTIKFTILPANQLPFLCQSEWLYQASPSHYHHIPSATSTVVDPTSCASPCDILTSHPRCHLPGLGHHHMDQSISFLGGLPTGPLPQTTVTLLKWSSTLHCFSSLSTTVGAPASSHWTHLTLQVLA